MRLLPDLVLTPEGWQRERAIAVTDGRIAMVRAAGASQRGDVALPGRAMVPGTVNTHNHSFQSLLRGIGDDLPFLEWRDRALYRYSPRLAPTTWRTAALFAFGEMLLHGVTTVCDFYYLNAQGNEQRLGDDRGGAPARHPHRAGALLLRLGRRAGARTARRSRRRSRTSRRCTRATTIATRHRHDPAGAAQPARRDARDDRGRRGGCAADAGVPWHIHLAEEQYQVDAVARAVRRAAAPRGRPRCGVDLATAMIAVHGVLVRRRASARCSPSAAPRSPTARARTCSSATASPISSRCWSRAACGSGSAPTAAARTTGVSVFDEMRTCALLQKVRRSTASAVGRDLLRAGHARRRPACSGSRSGGSRPGSWLRSGGARSR